MKRAKTILLIIIPLCLLSGLMGKNRPVWAVATVDHRIYAQLLKRYVKDGVIDYQGFKKQEDQLGLYLELLAKIDPGDLPRNEEFAFYINAYNAWTIKLILTGYPGVQSIKDLGSFFKSPWKKKLCRIDGKDLSLDDIEHKILRPRFQDPRVHFAINCASKSCPPLLSDPYRGSILDIQLDRAVEAFINDPAQNYLKDATLYVSKIFEWFKEDFNNDIIGFVTGYARGDFKKRLQSEPNKITVKYLDYDWSLNGK